MTKFLLINGPNLNLLGTREPAHYGHDTLASITERLTSRADAAGCALEAFQSNAEHELVERVQAAAAAGVDAMILNPAAFTHTSVALRDAVVAADMPFVEVHLSNIHAREPFRRQSYFSDRAAGVITGLGPQGYDLALEAVLTLVDTAKD